MDFMRKNEHVRIFKANDVDPRERAVRLYQSSPDSWDLQVRGPLGVGFMGIKDGKDFVIASAAHSRADLLALRTAVDEALGCVAPDLDAVERFATDAKTYEAKRETLGIGGTAQAAAWLLGLAAEVRKLRNASAHAETEARLRAAGWLPVTDSASAEARKEYPSTWREGDWTPPEDRGNFWDFDRAVAEMDRRAACVTVAEP